MGTVVCYILAAVTRSTISPEFHHVYCILQDDEKRERGPISRLEGSRAENMSLMGSRLTRAFPSEIGMKTDSRTVRNFEVEELVFVAHVVALKNGSIWPAFQYIFYGQCPIFLATHQRYELFSRMGKSTGKPVHAQRLVRYHSRQD